MLSPAYLYVPQLHPFCLPFPQPLKPGKKPNLWNSSYKDHTEALCLASRDHSSSDPVHKSVNFPLSEQYPSADFSIDLRIDKLRDPKWVAYWIQSCSTMKEVKRLHSVVVRCFDSSETYVYNSLISVYVRFRKLFEARKVFDNMLERSVVSWTAILTGYLRLDTGDAVLQLLNEFIASGVQPNSKTYACILNLCGRRFDFELGKQIHACIVKGHRRNLIVDSSVVYLYARCGDLSGAFQWFNWMAKRDVVSWTTMITAFAQNGHGDKAFSMLSLMRAEGFCPNEFTVCSVLKACGEEKSLKFGKQLHGAIIKRFCKDDVFIGSSLVHMYVRCKEVKDARRVFDGMKRRNTVTWTSMIAGYSQNGLAKEAISLFRMMKKRHVLVSNLTVVSILHACGILGALVTGKEVHAQILKNSFQGNVFSGSTLVWFYCKCAKFSYAAKVFRSMPDKDVVSWTAIISGCAHLDLGLEALQFFNEMLWEGVSPNPFTYSSALKACSKLDLVFQGKWIHSSVNKTQILPNVIVGSALIGMYAKCGHVTEAFQVFDSMPKRNLVSWKAMVVGYARNGFCREALQLMYRMQAEGFEVDDYVVKTVLNACGGTEWSMESLTERIV